MPLVTVEWEVVEIPLEDRYEIVLKATFETDVPAAVVVAEPPSFRLPKMEPGDVYQGEFTLTNYGLIRADNVHMTPPPPDPYFRYEYLVDLPETLEAKQRITVPYRVISLRSLDRAEDGTASGGGCSSYSACATISSDSQCPAGVQSGSAASHCAGTGGGCCPGGGGSVGSSGSGVGVGSSSGSGSISSSGSSSALTQGCAPDCESCGGGGGGGGGGPGDGGGC